MMISTRWTARRALVPALGACALAIVGLALLAREPSGSDTLSPAPLGSAEFARSADTTLARDEAVRIASSVPEPAPAREPAQPAACAPASTASAQPIVHAVDLRSSFYTPEGHEIVLASASIDIAHEDGTRREVTVQNSSWVLIGGLQPGRHTVDVRAEGFTHRTQVVDLNAETQLGRDARLIAPEAPHEQRLIVWPAGWIAVIVRTPDGRPFRDLATDLDVEPMRLFVGGFHVRTRLAPPDLDVREEKAPATFRPPRGYQSWEVTDGVIGSLQLLQPPPLWVGLDLLGVPLNWQLLHPGEQEIAFELDLAAFDERCARLRLRVIEAGTRAPLPDAKVTLRADTSAHRRKDQQEVTPQADGTVELERILPGRYELSIVRGDAFAQQRILLAAREARDLGDVALENGIALAVRVDAEDGSPVVAWVEIGPYEPGGRVDALYPPMLHRQTEADGRCALPIPAGPSILRASIEGSRSNGRPSGGAYTSNVLVERSALPAPPLVLVVREPVDVRFDTSAHELATIEVRDELDLVVVAPPRNGKKTLRCDLIPGRYRARFLDVQGNLIGETPFEVQKTPVRVLGP